MTIKPGYHKAKNGCCVVVLSRVGQRHIAVLVHQRRSGSWLPLLMLKNGRMCYRPSRRARRLDIVEPWPKDEPIPPGLPQIIFEVETNPIQDLIKNADEAIENQMSEQGED